MGDTAGTVAPAVLYLLVTLNNKWLEFILKYTHCNAQ